MVIVQVCLHQQREVPIVWLAAGVLVLHQQRADLQSVRVGANRQHAVHPRVKAGRPDGLMVFWNEMEEKGDVAYFFTVGEFVKAEARVVEGENKPKKMLLKNVQQFTYQQSTRKLFPNPLFRSFAYLWVMDHSDAHGLPHNVPRRRAFSSTLRVAVPDSDGRLLACNSTYQPSKFCTIAPNFILRLFHLHFSTFTHRRWWCWRCSGGCGCCSEWSR